MINLYEQLSHKQQGMLLIAIGAVLLLHTMGVIERGLNWIIIATSIAMIIHGFFKADVFNWIMRMIKKEDQ